MSKKLKRKSSREPINYDSPFEHEQDEVPLAIQHKYKITLVYLIDQDEVNRLIETSAVPYVDPSPSEMRTDYTTYSEEEVIALQACNYHPRKLRRKK